MTVQRSLESRKQGQPLCAQGGQGATKTGIRVCASKGAKLAGNLVRTRDHPHTSFDPKGTCRSGRQGPDGELVCAQTIQQGVSRTVFDSSPMAWRVRCTRAISFPVLLWKIVKER